MKTGKKSYFSIESRRMPQPRAFPVRYPVLLCHGYGTIAGYISPSPLHKVCMHLRKHAVRAYAPNVVPYGKIETRAAEWLKTLGIILKETGAKKVNIIAYSMGGLDIRYMIHRHQLGDVVGSLVTVSTPHRGSSLAEIALNTPEVIQKQMLSITDIVGNKVYPSVQSNAKGALQQLIPAYINGHFNKKMRDVPGIQYFSYSSACGKGTEEKINPSLILFNRLIFENEGINDGFVSRDSAVYGDHIRTTCLSHLEMIKLSLMQEHEKEWYAFWEEAMQLLVDNRL